MALTRHTGERYQEVAPSEAELAEWRRSHSRQAPPYRVACRQCGSRIWLSGLGVGAHERGVKHLRSRGQPRRRTPVHRHAHRRS